MCNKRMLYGITSDSNKSMLERDFDIVAVFKNRAHWENQDWVLDCLDDEPLRATENEQGFTVWSQKIKASDVQYVAKIKKTSEYANQDSGEPFPVRLSSESKRCCQRLHLEGRSRRTLPL